MAVKKVSQVGEVVIRAKAKPVTKKNVPELTRLIRDMTDTLHATNLIGIAAPQIGIGLQVFITELAMNDRKKKVGDAEQWRVFINPKITWRSEHETVLEEGCGSVCHSGLFGPVQRPAEVEVQALDEHMQPFTLKVSGLLAKCIQHEFDHLQGVVVLDKFTDTRKCWVA
ncbi:MAG: peptide deformylase [Candidatus Doudnabacteria bacterium]|nr:peptide deformylase [Candidatus Doudnabacteria bacterium]